MKDIQGRSWKERRRENKFEKSFGDQDELNINLKDVMQHPEHIETLRKFTSGRSLIKSLLPQLIIGGIIAYIEYDLIGIVYTVVSLVVFYPIIYLYAMSLRTRTGLFLMVLDEDGMDFERLFVSEQIWSLVNKKTGLTLEQSKINGRITYWCSDAKFLDGTNIPYYVEIAWAHYNRTKYMMFSSVIDDLTDMLKETLLEVAKLKQMSKAEAITEGTRQTKEMIDTIETAFRSDVHEILQKQGTAGEQASLYEQNVNELLNDPTFLRALIEKRKKEKEAQPQ